MGKEGWREGGREYRCVLASFPGFGTFIVVILPVWERGSYHAQPNSNIYVCNVMCIHTCTQTHYFTFVIRFNNQRNFILFLGPPSPLLALREGK